MRATSRKWANKRHEDCLRTNATSYGALPRTKQQRTALAGILNNYVCAHFPEYAKFLSGAGVIGVPGFWQELSGTVHDEQI